MSTRFTYTFVFCLQISLVHSCGVSSKSLLKTCLGPGVKTSSIDNSKLDSSFGSTVDSLSELDCDFTSQCCWGQIAAGEVDWYQVSGATVPGRLKKCFGTTVRPTGNFAAAYRDKADPTGQDSALLASCSIECTEEGTVDVKLRHWISEGVKLEVCSVTTFGGEILQCSQITGSNPGPTTVTLQVPKCSDCDINDGQSAPVDIYILASNFNGPKGQGGVVAIDDVEVSGATLGQCSFNPTTTTTTTEAATTEEALVCQAACDFSSNDKCAFTDLNTGTKFAIHSERIGNRDTGVPGPTPNSDSYYAGVSMTPNTRAVMKTGSLSGVTQGQPRRLKFKYYEATADLQLRVCLNGESNCPFVSNQAVQVSDRNWKDATLDITQAVDTISFVAENGNNYGSVGIDDLQVVNEGGQPVCT